MSNDVDDINKAIALAESLRTTSVTDDRHAEGIIDVLSVGVLAMEASIKTLLENNERLVRAVNEAPEFERAVKAATTGENHTMRELLRDTRFYLKGQDIKFGSGAIVSQWSLISPVLQDRIDQACGDDEA